MNKIIQGDITTLAVDAIVNVANQVMLGNAPQARERCYCKLEKGYNPCVARKIEQAVKT